MYDGMSVLTKCFFVKVHSFPDKSDLKLSMSRIFRSVFIMHLSLKEPSVGLLFILYFSLISQMGCNLTGVISIFMQLTVLTVYLFLYGKTYLVSMMDSLVISAYLLFCVTFLCR